MLRTRTEPTSYLCLVLCPRIESQRRHRQTPSLEASGGSAAGQRRIRKWRRRPNYVCHTKFNIITYLHTTQRSQQAPTGDNINDSRYTPLIFASRWKFITWQAVTGYARTSFGTCKQASSLGFQIVYHMSHLKILYDPRNTFVPLRRTAVFKPNLQTRAGLGPATTLLRVHNSTSLLHVPTATPSINK